MASIGKVLLIIVVVSFSVIKTAGLYFWHDDFSIIYTARTGHCVVTWPYHSYCTIFSFLEKIFNYSAPAYFGFAFLLFIFSVFAFSFFVKQFHTKKTAFLLTLVYATGYIGAGVFLEIYDSVTTFLSLGLLFWSLGLQISAFKSQKQLNFWALCLYVFSVLILQARSQTYIFPYLAIIFLFAPKMRKIKPALLVLGVHIIVCVLAYFSSRPVNISDTSLLRSLFGLNMIVEFKEFFQTLSYIYLPENFRLFILLKMNDAQIMFTRFTVGLLVSSCVFILLLKSLNKETQKIFYLGLVWLIFIYLPFGIRSDLAIWTTHRYLIYTFPGILIIWGLFDKYRLWKWLTLIVIIFSVYKVNVFLDPYLLNSRQRQSFYLQYRSLTKEIPKGAVVFFDSPQKLVSKLGDYFRVGFLPSEAAIATEKAVFYTDVRIFVESQDFLNYISENTVEVDKIFSYYYDGEKLFDTTEIARNILKGSKKSIVLFSGERVFSTKLAITPNGTYQGKNNEFVIKTRDHEFILPAELELRMTSYMPKLSLPYDHGCQTGDDLATAGILNFLGQTSEIMNQVKDITTDKIENNLFIKNIIDGEYLTYWFAGSRSWVNKERPRITLNFGKRVSIFGVVIQTIPGSSAPTDYEFSNGQKVFDYSVTKISDSDSAYIFDENMQSDLLELRVLRTAGGSRPVIHDLILIPSNYKKSYLSKINKYRQCPATSIKTSEDLTALTSYLSKGTWACIKWESKNYGSGKVNFRIYLDGRKHTYQVPLPAIGMGAVDLKLGCFEYPVRTNINFIGVNHLELK